MYDVLLHAWKLEVGGMTRFGLLALLFFASIFTVSHAQSNSTENDGFCNMQYFIPSINSSVREGEYDKDCDQLGLEVIQKGSKVFLKVSGMQVQATETSDAQNFIGLKQHWQLSPVPQATNGALLLSVEMAVSDFFLKLNEEQSQIIELGALPNGNYQLEAKLINNRCGICGIPPYDNYRKHVFKRIDFEVEAEGYPFYFSQYDPRSTVDYSGFWYDPNNSGWGLNIQTALQSKILAAAWYDYTEENQPTWRMIESGRWLDAKTYEASIYQTAPKQNASGVTRTVEGDAKFHFNSPTEMIFEVTKGDQTETRNLVKIPLK